MPFRMSVRSLQDNAINVLLESVKKSFFYSIPLCKHKSVSLEYYNYPCPACSLNRKPRYSKTNRLMVNHPFCQCSNEILELYCFLAKPDMLSICTLPLPPILSDLILKKCKGDKNYILDYLFISSTLQDYEIDADFQYSNFKGKWESVKCTCYIESIFDLLILRCNNLKSLSIKGLHKTLFDRLSTKIFTSFKSFGTLSKLSIEMMSSTLGVSYYKIDRQEHDKILFIISNELRNLKYLFLQDFIGTDKSLLYLIGKGSHGCHLIEELIFKLKCIVPTDQNLLFPRDNMTVLELVIHLSKLTKFEIPNNNKLLSVLVNCRKEIAQKRPDFLNLKTIECDKAHFEVFKLLPQIQNMVIYTTGVRLEMPLNYIESFLHIKSLTINIEYFEVGPISLEQKYGSFLTFLKAIGNRLSNLEMYGDLCNDFDLSLVFAYCPNLVYLNITIECFHDEFDECFEHKLPTNYKKSINYEVAFSKIKSLCIVYKYSYNLFPVMIFDEDFVLKMLSNMKIIENLTLPLNVNAHILKAALEAHGFRSLVKLNMLISEDLVSLFDLRYLPG